MKTQFTWRSIEEYVRRPQNNYLILRFAAALMVIYGHSYALTKLPHRRDLVQRLLHFTYSGAVGVDIFFVISGFLVTASYLNRNDFGNFVKARFLRIFPALLVCIFCTAFLLGPAVTSLPLARYLTEPGPFLFLLSNTTLVRLQGSLPGVFENLPEWGVNGSLWTLPIEVRLYALLALFGVTGVLFKRRWYFWLILALSVIAIVLPFNIPLVYAAQNYARLCIFFGIGSVMCVYRDRIPLSTVILAALILACLPFHATRLFPWMLGGALAYGVMWCAYVPNLRWFNRMGDYSYGLYIYAFPIQQTLRQYFVHIGPLQMFAAASVLTLLCAALSWHLVEEPALRLKKTNFRDLYARLVGRERIVASSGE